MINEAEKVIGQSHFGLAELNKNTRRSLRLHCTSLFISSSSRHHGAAMVDRCVFTEWQLTDNKVPVALQRQSRAILTLSFWRSHRRRQLSSRLRPTKTSSCWRSVWWAGTSAASRVTSQQTSELRHNAASLRLMRFENVRRHSRTPGPRHGPVKRIYRI